MKGITSVPFGTTENGEAVRRFTLENASGAYVCVLDYGCTLTNICVPDKTGTLRDVCLGWKTLEAYEQNPGYLGATVGRCANRLANGRFELGGKEYQLYLNDGANHLHGGKRGFNRYVWQHAIKGDSLVFTRTSPDGEEGYPGTMQLKVTFTFSDTGALTIAYEGVSDSDTIFNMTNHCYFNLEGHDSGTILNHELQVRAYAYNPVGAGQIPTGEIRPVEGTAFDFNTPKAIGRDIAGTADEQIIAANGYDHNFALSGEGMREVVVLKAPESGITMTVSTQLPGVQVYTANKVQARVSKSGVPYGPHTGICLETQQFPDAVHHANFPQAILPAGEVCRHSTTFQFGVEK